MITRKKNLVTVIFCLFLIGGAVVRFYHFSDRINFGPEQGLALTTSAGYIHGKFSFLGQRTFLRTTSQGHILFSGAVYNYSLVPLLLIFRYQPLPITAVFTLINLLTAVIMYWLFRKVFSERVAIYAVFLFLFSALMINHSLFIWILHYLPLVAVLTIYFLISFYRVRQPGAAVLLGILSGLGVNFEYFYIFTLVLVGLAVFCFSRDKIRDLALFVFGYLIGNSTMILFDLRHNFYYTRELWQYTLETIEAPRQSQINSYHFFQYWPLLFLAGAYMLDRIHARSFILSLSFCGLYLFWNLTSPLVSFNSAMGMPPGLTLPKIQSAARLIAKDAQGSFNLVSLPENDFRAYNLRYLVTYLYKKIPAPMEDYQSVDRLYILAQSDFGLKEGLPWEITAFKPTEVTRVAAIDSRYAVYRLEHRGAASGFRGTRR